MDRSWIQSIAGCIIKVNQHCTEEHVEAIDELMNTFCFNFEN